MENRLYFAARPRVLIKAYASMTSPKRSMPRDTIKFALMTNSRGLVLTWYSVLSERINPMTGGRA